MLVPARARTEVDGATFVSILEVGLDLAVLVTGGRSGTDSGSAIDCLGLSGTGRNLLYVVCWWDGRYFKIPVHVHVFMGHLTLRRLI